MKPLSARQLILHEILAALDALPRRRLGFKKMHDGRTGDYCMVGALAKRRGIKSYENYEPDDLIGDPGLACLLFAVNDKDADETPTQRWIRTRKWLVRQLRKPAGEPLESMICKTDDGIVLVQDW